LKWDFSAAETRVLGRQSLGAIGGVVALSAHPQTGLLVVVPVAVLLALTPCLHFADVISKWKICPTLESGSHCDPLSTFTMKGFSSPNRASPITSSLA